MTLYKYSISTTREGFFDITGKVSEAVRESGADNGICVVYCPHTTAGITVNENADPDVVRDMLLALNKIFPDMPEFRHSEGNSHAHLKSSAMGTEKNFILENGKLLLGTWQGIYFCEFDGPRHRNFYVKIINN